MIITFLGTGTSQGVPVIACDCPVCQSIDFRDKRTRTSVHIKTKKASVIIDSGPDFRHQVLRERIPQLDALVFTHEHKDHTAGLDDIRSFNFKQKIDMPIYGRQHVINQLKREFAYIFEELQYPGVPKVDTRIIDSEPFDIHGETLTPIEVFHHKLPVLGFRVQDFTYITDANAIPDQEKPKIEGSKVLVLNALQKEPHISHFNLDQAVEVVADLKPQQAYFTHISHKLGMHRDIEDILPKNVALAYDGLKIEI